MWRENVGASKQLIPHRWEYAFTQPGKVGHHHRVVCSDCGAWLPLGPSNDDPIQVSTEIRAAMHLAEANHQLGQSSTWQEALGVAAFDMDNDPPAGDLAWLWHAGWLARAAWTTCSVCGFESPVPCRHTAADLEGAG